MSILTYEQLQKLISEYGIEKTCEELSRLQITNLDFSVNKIGKKE